MLEALIRRFVPDCANTEDTAVRARYGVLAGGLGIALNLLLFAVKLPVGLAVSSMAIVSDAFNNLSDMGSSVIALIGMKMSTRRPDAEHPFGHGRIEYISALMVALVIVLVGIELIRESVPAIFDPQTGALPLPMAAVMVLSLLVKLWMMRYNKVIGERIHAGVIIAASKDSRNDVITTAAVLASALMRPHVSFPVDAIAGILVALLILKSGFDIAGETIGQLLGGRPDAELVQKISAIVTEPGDIVGIHDMIVHDYGPGRTMASVHAEVPDDMDIHAAHELIDEIEQRIRQDLGIQTVIHMDPVPVGDARVDRVRAQLERTIARIDGRMSMHDFRMAQGEGTTDLIFDLVMPFEMTEEDRYAAVYELEVRMKTINPAYRCVIQQDENYAECD